MNDIQSTHTSKVAEKDELEDNEPKSKDVQAMFDNVESTHHSQVAEEDELEDNGPKSNVQAMFDNAESLNELQLPITVGINSDSENLKPEKLKENAAEIKEDNFSDIEPELSDSVIKSDRVTEDLNYPVSELSFQKVGRLKP